MTTNPSFSVVFYQTPTPRQRGRGDTPIPLRIRVWVGATKRFLFVSTGVSITPRQFSAFSSDGTPSNVADPRLIKVMDKYRAAVQYVVSGAIVHGKIDTLTSAELKSRVEGVLTRMEANEKGASRQPISPFAAPVDVPTCSDCVFCGMECSAPWDYDHERNKAAEFANYNGLCKYRVIQTGEGYMWQPTPNKTISPITNPRLVKAVREMEKKSEI